ncbi:cytochrome P450 [Phaeosphaeriaceae sp. PMI808]|nr:cytochrome P450 [Phaeosphaeriaceae sp. PMI808]
MGVLTSWRTLASLAILTILGRLFYSLKAKRERYAKLQAEPPIVLSSWSFGLNFVVSMFRAILTHKFVDWTQDILNNNHHTVELHMLGASLLLTDDPENIKAVQDTQFTEVAKSEEQHEIFKHILGDAIFGLNGEEWKKETAVLKPHMSRVRESDFEVTERHLKSAFDILAIPGRDAFDTIDRFVLDVVTEVFCGESTNSLTSNQQPFRDAMDKLLKIASFRQLLGKAGLYLRDDWIAPSATKFIDRYLDAFADHAYAREADLGHTKDLTLIGDMIQRGKSRADVKNAVCAILLAGKDPTTTTLAWAYYELAKHPEVFAKMKAEVKEHLGADQIPTLQDFHKMKYIRMVIKETLRVHHPLGYNARVPVKDMTLPRGGGPDGRSPVAVLKETQIFYSLLSLQLRDDMGVEDVNAWNPDRWETWRPRNKWEYIPFNYGPRICIGQVFGNFQMEYFFVRLCQEFESITLLPDSKPQEGLVRLELNTKTAHPILTRSVRVARK